MHIHSTDIDETLSIDTIDTADIPALVFAMLDFHDLEALRTNHFHDSKIVVRKKDQ